jgi:hypothetical protein
MTIGSFLGGVLLMAIGFFMVYRTNVFEDSLGNLGDALGLMNANWLSWKLLGILFLIIGFLVAFSLLQLFLALTIGQFVHFGAPV